MSMLRFLQDWVGKCSNLQESIPTEKAKSYASSSEDKMLKDVTEETKLSAITWREDFLINFTYNFWNSGFKCVYIEQDLQRRFYY